MLSLDDIAFAAFLRHVIRDEVKKAFEEQSKMVLDKEDERKDETAPDASDALADVEAPIAEVEEVVEVGPLKRSREENLDDLSQTELLTLLHKRDPSAVSLRLKDFDEKDVDSFFCKTQDVRDVIAALCLKRKQHLLKKKDTGVAAYDTWLWKHNAFFKDIHLVALEKRRKTTIKKMKK